VIDEQLAPAGAAITKEAAQIMSATVSHPRTGRWLDMLLSRQPHQIINNSQHPYLQRWYLLPRNRRLNIYLHRFVASDDPVGLHDHPWWFASLILHGHYKRAELHWMQHCDDDKNDFSRWSGRVRWVRIATGGPS
jgi:hypothetical protein